MPKTKEISLHEFHEKTETYIHDASPTHTIAQALKYIIPIETDRGTVKIILTSRFNVDANPKEIRDLRKQQKNPDALARHLDLALARAAKGETIGLKINTYEGNKTAYLVLEDRANE